MAGSTKYTCDICQVQRGEANHWFMARNVNVSKYESSRIVIEQWDEQTAHANGTKHLCGRECLTKQMHKFLDEATQ